MGRCLKLFQTRFLFLWALISLVACFPLTLQAENTTVQKIKPTIVSPYSPPPADTPFKLQAEFFPAGNGQPCHISNIEATINGQTVIGRPYEIIIHADNIKASAFFNFGPGFPSGTDVTPTFSYTTETQNGKSSCDCQNAPCVDSGQPISPIPVPPTPRLVVDKELAKGQPVQVEPNETVSYVLIVENTGNGAAANVTITDVLNTYLLYEGSGTTPSSAPAKGATGTVTWSLASLASGAKVSITLNTRVAPSAPQGAILNSATARVGSVDSTSGRVSVNVNRVPALTLVKTINDKASQLATLPAGSPVTYFFTYENTGSGTANSVVLTDVLPVELTGTPQLFPGAPVSSYDATTRRVTWNLGSLSTSDGPQEVSVVSEIDAAASGYVENRAEVTWTDGTTLGSANSNYAGISVIAEPFFGLTKVVDKANAGPGDELTYTIGYENTGGAAGVNTVVTDTIPAGLTPCCGLVPGCDLCAGRDGLGPRHPHLVVAQCVGFCDGVADLQGHGRCGHTPQAVWSIWRR